MIVEYHRPGSLEEALELLNRAQPITVPIGGGSGLDRSAPQPVAVVDLQSLGLDTIRSIGNNLEIGATVTLDYLLKDPSLWPALRNAIRQEANYNQRQVATIAGSLVACSGRSPFATALLALDAQLILLPDGQPASLGDLLPLRAELLRGKLVSQVKLPLNVRMDFQYVARTPADWPLVCAALARWPSGRTRLALGGYGGAPILGMDGPEAEGLEIAARDAYRTAGDQWATAEYRSEMAGVLARRCLEAVQAEA